MIVKIFTKAGCPKCPPAKELGKTFQEKGEDVKFYNLDESDGLAEGAMYDVMATPTIIVCDKQGGEIKSFRGEAPSLEDVAGDR